MKEELDNEFGGVQIKFTPDRTIVGVPPTKTPEELQQEAEQKGWLDIWHEFTLGYPWYRVHFVSLPFGVKEYDLGISLLPFGDSLKYAELLIQRIADFLPMVIWSIVIGVATAEFSALLASQAGPVGFVAALAISAATKLGSFCAVFDSVEGLASVYLGSLFSTVLGLLRLSFQLVSDVIRLLLKIKSLAEFGFGKLYTLISIPVSIAYQAVILHRLDELGVFWMTKNRTQRFRKALGFLFLVVGVLLLCLVPPILAWRSWLAAWVSIWPIVSIIGLGAFLIFELGLNDILKSWLIAMAVTIPWGMIFFIPLPSDLQILLAALVALAGVLFYRYYQRRKSKKPFTIQIRRLPFRKAIGGLLVIVGLVLFYFVIPIALSFGLFVTWLVAWPIFFVVILGCSLILRIGFGEAVEWLFSAIILTLIPWIVVLPSELQIVSGSLLVLGLILALLYWYYRKYRPRKPQ